MSVNLSSNQISFEARGIRGNLKPKSKKKDVMEAFEVVEQRGMNKFPAMKRVKKRAREIQKDVFMKKAMNEEGFLSKVKNVLGIKN